MRTALAVLTLALLAAAAPVAAEFPYPANPAPCSGPSLPPQCIPATDWSRYLFLPAANPPQRPNDFQNDWKLTSDTTGEPEIDDNPQELFGVKGASVDLAWQVTTGRPDVVIAVLDSGIRWGERFDDLVNKFYLNRRELPVPEGSTNSTDPHDRNGDGIFNVRDYLANAGFAHDSRVTDQNGTGAIDPEDLIFLFSDGVDDDDNGYVDDISGWDFWEDDNNALDEPRYSHGTGESEDSAAEANNGMGNVGSCPNCMLLEVRVGDSFVTPVDKFAQGVIFATDSGARVVQEALGTLNNSDFAQQAVDYAYHRGVIVMASAADEESAHNNWPANYSHTFEINSVVKFFESGGIVQSPRSYLYLNGCTNYNGHIAVAVPSSSCSSEATGKSSGMAGLVYSAALNAIDRGELEPYPGGQDPNMPLSAEEVKQIFTRTADDVNFDARDNPQLPQNYHTEVPLPGVQQTSTRFPSIEGFDQYFGYGRINADAAVRRVAAGQIPPEAAIDSPRWHAYLSPRQGSIAV
ncbi:MAG TPA: S8 family serine peptidase, partial [Terriglobales bacterium]|nr:S8 family serine peptidase [Terriglobales bacterium]